MAGAGRPHPGRGRYRQVDAGRGDRRRRPVAAEQQFIAAELAGGLGLHGAPGRRGSGRTGPQGRHHADRYRPEDARRGTPGPGPAPATGCAHRPVLLVPARGTGALGGPRRSDSRGLTSPRRIWRPPGKATIRREPVMTATMNTTDPRRRPRPRHRGTGRPPVLLGRGRHRTAEHPPRHRPWACTGTWPTPGPSTSPELADAAGLDERYVREWLQAQAVSGLLTFDGPDVTTARFALPPAATEVLLHELSPAYLAPLSDLLASTGAVMPALTEAFRTGAGVPVRRLPRGGRRPGRAQPPRLHQRPGHPVAAGRPGHRGPLGRPGRPAPSGRPRLRSWLGRHRPGRGVPARPRRRLRRRRRVDRPSPGPTPPSTGSARGSCSRCAT